MFQSRRKLPHGLEMRLFPLRYCTFGLLRYDITGFLLWSAKYWRAGHHENHNGELTDQGESHIFWIFEGWFLLVCKRKWPKQSFAWVWPAVLSHPAPASFMAGGCWGSCASLSPYPSTKIFLKNISLFSQPRKKVQVGSPLPFSCKPGKRLQLGTAWGVSECWQLQHYWKLYLNEDAAMWKLFLAK